MTQTATRFKRAVAAHQRATERVWETGIPALRERLHERYPDAAGVRVIINGDDYEIDNNWWAVTASGRNLFNYVDVYENASFETTGEFKRFEQWLQSCNEIVGHLIGYWAGTGEQMVGSEFSVHLTEAGE